MKRLKTFAIAIALTAVLAGNIFATGGTVSAATSPTGLLTYAVSAVLAMFGADDQCPLRQCTHCKPNNGNNDGGDCRPDPS